MNKIRQKVQNLKKKYGTDNPFEICQEMGIQIIYRELPDCVNGFFLQILKNYIIILNDNLDYEQSRVIVAHELGHIFLHGGTNSFQLSTLTDIYVEKLERQADYFASCLLIDRKSIAVCDESDCITIGDIACANRVPVYFAELYTRMM